MGQGSYQAFVFGAVMLPDFDIEAFDQKVRRPREIDCSYECDDFWVGVRMTATSGMDSLDEDFGGAFPISELPERLDTVATRARPMWEKFRETAKEAGFDFPEGQILCVFDSD